MIVYGLIIVLAAWLAVPYAVVVGLLLLVVAWGPTPAFRQIPWIVLFTALLALGVTALQRQTAKEFPAIEHGEALRDVREHWSAGARTPPVPACRPLPPTLGSTPSSDWPASTTAGAQRRGVALQKSHVMNSG